MPTSLGLPDGTKTKMFRAIVDVLKSDPVVSRVVNEWFCWDGKPTDGGEIPFLPVSKVNMRLTPRMNELSFWSPDSMKGYLTVLIETTIPGNAIDDMLNLEDAIENAFYPKEGIKASAMRNRFTQIGAMTGLVMFTQPIYDNTLPERADQNFHALGEVRIEVRDIKARCG